MILCFNGFKLDLDQGHLIDPTGVERPLRHKCFHLLRHLAENAGRVVSREELLDALWPGIFVGDESVTQCVAEVRRALGEAGTQLLRTLPKRGYLLAAAVQQSVPAPSVLSSPSEGVPPRVAVSADDVSLTWLAGAAAPSAARIEAFLESYLVSEQEPGAVPFGGRDSTLTELDQWLDDPGAESRLLLVAPAGRGKSALLAQWARRLAEMGRIGEDPGRWSLVFVPVSMRFGTNRPAVFLEAVAARLAALLGAELPSMRGEPVEHFAAQCRRLLSEAAATGVRVLVVLDGIDEALGGRFEAAWFPRRPGPSLRLLLSARQQVGDYGTLASAARLGWDGAERVRAMELPTLSAADVTDLLCRAGGTVAPLAARPDFAVRLHDLTGGEPLLLRLHVEELLGAVEHPAATAAEKLGPVARGLRGVFDAWLSRQRDAWAIERTEGEAIDEALLEAYLGVLACAHGPLLAEELDGMVRRVHSVPPGLRVERILHPLRRFIIGSHHGGGYVLSHPRLGEFLREDYLDAHRIAEVRRSFAEWGRDAIRRTQLGASVPSYLLQFLGQHFEDACVPADAYMEMVEEGWLRAWQSFEGGHSGFAADVRRAARAIVRDGPGDSPAPVMGWRLRCALVLSSTLTANGQISADLLLDCVEARVVSPGQALAWSAGRSDRAGIISDLAPLLPEPLLMEALAIARALPEECDRAEALAALAEHLPVPRREAVREEALKATQAVEEAPVRALVLVGLADRLPDKDRLKLLAEALDAACRAEPGRPRTEALVALAPDLPEALLGRALEAARACPDTRDRARATTAIAVRLPGVAREEGLAEALAAVRMIDPPAPRTGLLAALAQALPESVRAGVFTEALTAARAIGHGGALAGLAKSVPPSLIPEVLASAQGIGARQRARVLAACAGRLEGSAHAALLAEALACARAIGNEEFRAEALTELMPLLQPPLMADALAASRALVYEGARAAALVGLVEAEPESTDLFDEALTTARLVLEGPRRAGLLARLSRQLRGPARAALLDEALTAARRSGDESGRVKALGALANYLPPPQRGLVVGDALVIARSIPDNSERIRVLIALIGGMPEPERTSLAQEELVAARNLDQPYVRAWALGGLAALLPSPVASTICEEVLAAAPEKPGENGFSKATALSQLPLKAIPPERVAELLGLADTLQYETIRYPFLTKLVPFLPPAMLEKAVALAREPLADKGRDRPGRVQLLLALARRLTDASGEGLRGEALADARSVPHNQQRAAALAAVSDALPETVRSGVLEEALASARAIVDPQFRVQTLGNVAAHLSEPDRALSFDEALNIAVDIPDDWSRSAALASLAQGLPAPLQPVAVAAARKIGEERPRATALTTLAPHVPPEMRGAVLKDALAAARAVADPPLRAEALATLIALLKDPLRAEALQAFLDCAGDLARLDLLVWLPAFLPAIASVDPPSGLYEVHRAVRDVGRWFE